MNTIIHNGDVGTTFRLTITDTAGTAIDISAASTKKIYFYAPDGSKLAKTAVFTTDGKDGQIEYVSVSGDIDVTGAWLAQGYIEAGTSKYYSEKITFDVLDNIA